MKRSILLIIMTFALLLCGCGKIEYEASEIRLVKYYDILIKDDYDETEISEIVGITRQGVRDAVMRAEMSLRDIEDKVGLVKRYSRLSDKVAQIGDCAHYIAMVNSGSKKDFQIAEQTNKILKIVGEIQ